MSKFKVWKSRISVAEECFTQEAQYHGWYRFIDYFNNKYAEHLHVDIPVTEINEVYAFIKTKVAGTYYRDPYITVNPVRTMDIAGAMIKEQSINYYWRVKKMKQHIKKAISEASLVGFSYVKVGYDADIHVKDIAGEVKEWVQSEDLWGIHVPWNRVLYDADALQPLSDARWVAQWFLKPTEYLRKKFKNEDIQSTSSINEHLGKRRRMKCKLDDADSQMTKVYEIWDKDTKARYLMCDGLDEWLEPPEIAKEDGMIGPLKIKGFPISMLYFNEILDISHGNYPMGDIAPQEEQIREKIKLRSMQLNHIKRFSRQVFVSPGLLDKKEEDKFIMGHDGAVIHAKTDLGPDKIWSPSYPNLQTDIYAIENRIDLDRDAISGQSTFERGASAQTKTRTLGEIQRIGKGTENRRNEQIDIIEDFSEEIAGKMLQIMKQFFDIKKTVRITGNPPQKILQVLTEAGNFDGTSITFTKEDIQGEEDIDVKMGSSLPLNKENRLAVIVDLLRFGPALGLVPGMLTPAVLGKNLMRDMDLKEVERAYDTDIQKILAPKKPSPEEQLKNQKTLSGIRNTEIDTVLKENRIKKGQLDIVGKLIGNRKNLEDLTNPKVSR